MHRVDMAQIETYHIITAYQRLQKIQKVWFDPRLLKGWICKV